MLKRIIICLCLAPILIAICAGVGLLILQRSVHAYADYWQGRASEAGEILYIALGDSTAQGIGASRPENGYVGRLADSISGTTGRRVRVINLSTSGATVHDVLARQIPKLEKLAPVIAKQEMAIVTLDVGSNDIIRGTTGKASFREDYEKIVQALPPEKAVIGDIPYFGGRVHADPQVRQANGIIRGLAKQYEVPVAPLYDQLRSRHSPWIYAADLFHPNDRGYAIWHDAFWKQVEPVLDGQRSLRLPVTDQPIPLPPAGR